MSANVERALSREDSVEAAIELRALVSLDALAELAADRDRSPRQRVIALLAVALALADNSAAGVPEAALEAMDEPEVVETALRAKLGAALTGVLAAAPLTPGLRATRLLVGRRLAAAGERGIHVAELMRCGGDHSRATELAAESLADRGSEVATWATVRWVCDRDDGTIEAILLKLPDNALSHVLASLASMPGAEPRGASRVRAMVGWIVSSRNHE